LSFWWKVSSDGGYDYLRFYLNETEAVAGISGEVDWQQVTLSLPPGTNVLRWRYSKDSSVVRGADSAYVDEFALLQNPPVIALQPQGLLAVAGGMATFGVGLAPGGLEPVAYQWSWNGVALAAATNQSLTLSNVGRAAIGLYSVAVSNAAGGVVSSNAALHVAVPQQLQWPVRQPDGRFHLFFRDADGQVGPDLGRFEVHVATNLLRTNTVWTTNVGGLVFTNGLIRFEDAGSSGAGHRFYRVLER